MSIDTARVRAASGAHCFVAPLPAPLPLPVRAQLGAARRTSRGGDGRRRRPLRLDNCLHSRDTDSRTPRRKLGANKNIRPHWGLMRIGLKMRPVRLRGPQPHRHNHQPGQWEIYHIFLFHQRRRRRLHGAHKLGAASTSIFKYSRARQIRHPSGGAAVSGSKERCMRGRDR